MSKATLETMGYRVERCVDDPTTKMQASYMVFGKAGAVWGLYRRQVGHADRSL